MKKSHFKKKYVRVGSPRKFFINTLYSMGLKAKRISRIVGVSQASVYRHINR